MESALDHTERPEEVNKFENIDDINKQFYENIKKNDILVRPPKKLREFSNGPAYFRIVENMLAPTPWIKNKEEIKKDMMNKGKFDIRFFKNPIDFFNIINSDMMK